MLRGSRRVVGANLHFLAASSEIRSKYLLGPGSLAVAAVTVPCSSITSRTDTLIVPRIVRSALGAASGITSSSGDVMASDSASAFGLRVCELLVMGSIGLGTADLVAAFGRLLCADAGAGDCNCTVVDSSVALAAVGELLLYELIANQAIASSTARPASAGSSICLCEGA
jgi:hypothetical protein